LKVAIGKIKMKKHILSIAISAAFAFLPTAFANAETLDSSNGTAAFQAEASFTGAGTFGFDLRQMPDDNLPSPSNTGVSTNTINWAGVEVNYGSNTFVNSRTVAFLTHDLIASQEVFLYTDNVNGTSYKIDITSAANASSLVETTEKGVTGVGSSACMIDLAYRIVSQTHFADSGANGVAVSSISKVAIGLDNHYNALYGTGFILDKSKPGVENSGKGRIVADGQGYWYGDIWYVYEPDVPVYMFFSANFGQARGGHYYGTDKLTVELVVNN